VTFLRQIDKKRAMGVDSFAVAVFSFECFGLEFVELGAQGYALEPVLL
jgi:hypothetical protein